MCWHVIIFKNKKRDVNWLLVSGICLRRNHGISFQVKVAIREVPFAVELFSQFSLFMFTGERSPWATILRASNAIPFKNVLEKPNRPFATYCPQKLILKLAFSTKKSAFCSLQSENPRTVKMCASCFFL